MHTPQPPVHDSTNTPIELSVPVALTVLKVIVYGLLTLAVVRDFFW